MRVLVTGAAGFIGSHVAERLLTDGDSVLGVDSFSTYYDPAVKRRNAEPILSHEAFELIEGDLNELELAPLMEGVDVVLHLAAQPGVRVSWGREFQIYLADNVLATQRLLEATRDTDVGRFVLASSSSVYGQAERFPTEESEPPRPVSPYGVTKHAAEELCHLYRSAHGVPAVALRYFTIYGPRQRPDMAFTRFIDAGLSGAPVTVYGDGGQSRSFTYVDDAARATVAAGHQGVPGEVYNVAGGSQVTVMETIAAIERLLDRKLEVHHEPPAAGDPRKTGADTSLAQRDLGFEPQTSFEDGLAHQFEAQAAAHAAG